MFKVRIITLAAILTVGGAVLAAAPIASAERSGPTPTATDDQNRGEAEPGDDNGGQVEPGDDKGSSQAEPGDDKGSSQAEPGDDKGSSQAEPGDDKNRNVAASAATGAIKVKTAAKAKHHTHIRHASHRRAAK